MAAAAPADAKLARRLVLDELFDLSLYRALRDVAPGDLRRVLDELIPVETRHHAFWQSFFGLELGRLDLGRRLKLALILAVCRLFGAPAIHLILESIEVHGVRKYLAIWHRYGAGPLGGAVREVLRDEFEDAGESRLTAAVVVGASYFAGALVPVLPVLAGARTALPSVLTAGTVIVVVSALLAFLSGMDVRRRVVMNVLITALAVLATYAIGLAAKALLGVSVV